MVEIIVTVLLCSITFADSANSLLLIDYPYLLISNKVLAALCCI